MPEIHDWRRVAEPRAVLRYAVQSLRAGRVVAFPTETGYVLSASARRAEAVQRLGEEAPILALRGAAEARDWAPEMTPLAHRLTRRLWPGPVTLRLGGGVERGLAGRLPDEVRHPLCRTGALHLAMPHHPAVREALRYLPDPLLLSPLSDNGAAAGDAEQVLRLAGERVDVIVDDGPSSCTHPATLVEISGDSWQVARPGVVSEEQIRRQMVCLIVFICTGNTCRSPLAEALCKRQLADRIGCTITELPERGYLVQSAGLAAMMGGPAAAEAEQVAQAYGGDLSAHRSQPLTAELAARADYLIGMTQSHLRALMDYFADCGGRIGLLDPNGDIADPIGCDRGVYEECGRQIRQHLEALVTGILGG